MRSLILSQCRDLRIGVDNRGSDGTGCFRIEVRTETAELSDMRIAGLRRERLTRIFFAKARCIS